VLGAACLLGWPTPTVAIVGDAELASQRIAQHLVLVRGSRSVCTGSILASDLVLTAAHCLRAGDKMEVRPYGERRFHRVREVVAHPQFERARDALPTRVDLALLKLATPLPHSTRPVLLARRPAATGEAVLVAGYGRHNADSLGITGQARMATLVTLEQRVGIQLLLRDPSMLQESARLGVCQGDSGGPAFAVRDALVVIGVVTAAPERCGGLTIVTPIATHYDWIIETARRLGSPVVD
jgi:hypothetical protein